jgi:hypothetical protein
VRLASTIEQPGKLKVWITCSDGRETSTQIAIYGLFSAWCNAPVIQ